MSRSTELQSWLNLVRRDGHILREHPSLLFQHAANEPESSSLAESARRRLVAGRELRPWFRLINKQTEEPTRLLTFLGHKSSVYSCCVSRDDRQLFSAGWDGVRVWDFTTGEQLFSEPVLKTRASFVTVKDDFLLVAEWEGRNRFAHLRLLQRDTWDTPRQSIPLNAPGAFTVSTKGEMAMSEGNQIGVITLGDSSPAREFVEPSVSYETGFVSLAFSADGSLLLALNPLGIVHGWDTKTWEKTLYFKTSVPDVRAVQLSPDHSMIALVRADGVLCYDVKSQRLHAILEGHTTGIEGCCFTNDRSRIVTWARDGSIIVWARPVEFLSDQRLPDQFTDWTSKKSGYRQSRAGSPLITACSFSARRSEIVAIDTDKGGMVLNAGTLQIERKIGGLTSYSDLAAKGHVYTACAVSPEGNSVVCGTKGGELRKHFLDDSTSRAWLQSAHIYAVTDLAFSQDGKQIVSVSEDGFFKLWDVASGNLQASERAHDGAVHAVRYSPSGDSFATASEDCTVKIWNVHQHPKAAARLQHSSAVRCAAYSSDGKQVITCTATGTVCVWSLDGPRLEKELQARAENARHCWCIPDSSLVIVTRDERATVILVDVGIGEIKGRFISGKSLMASAMNSDADRMLITTKPNAMFLLSVENCRRKHHDSTNR